MSERWTFESYIDGAWTAGEATGEYEVVNPATEAVIGTVPRATVGDARAAIGAARRAFDEGPWPWMTVPERAAAVGRFADALDGRRKEIADLLTAEVGMVASLEPIQVGEGLLAAHYCADYVEHGVEWEHLFPPTVTPASMGGRIIVREPIGVVGAITPFNFPFMLDMWKVAPALAVGCTVVLKPHPWTPLQSFVIAQAAEEACIPPGVLNVVVGDADIGDELTGSPLVDCIGFTGSTATGKRILERAASTVKKVQLELGGKSAQVVLPDVPPEIVATLGASGVITHCGQGCVLPTRTGAAREPARRVRRRRPGVGAPDRHRRSRGSEHRARPARQRAAALARGVVRRIGCRGGRTGGRGRQAPRHPRRGSSTSRRSSRVSPAR